MSSFRLFFCAPTHPRPPCSRVETHKRPPPPRYRPFPYTASVASARRRTSSASHAWELRLEADRRGHALQTAPRACVEEARRISKLGFPLSVGAVWGGARRCCPIANKLEDTRQKEQRVGCCCYGNAQAFQKGNSVCCFRLLFHCSC